MASTIYARGSATVLVPDTQKLTVFSNSSVSIYQVVGYPNQPTSLSFITQTTAGDTYLSSAVTGDTSFVVEAGAANAFYATGASPSVSTPQADITAADATFTITGLAAAQGGFVQVIGGTSSTTGNAGGASLVTGGLGGATGVGGAVTIVAGAGGATSGAGGAVTITGGAATAGVTNGGNVVITKGAKSSTGIDGALVVRALLGRAQATPVAGTGTATILISTLATGIITDTHVSGATAVYTLPTGTLTDAGLPSFSNDDAFDWYFINLSAAAADTATITADTGHTIVGNPIVQSSHVSTGGITGNSSHWRTRKTAANTFVSYRLV